MAEPDAGPSASCVVRHGKGPRDNPNGPALPDVASECRADNPACPAPPTAECTDCISDNFITQEAAFCIADVQRFSHGLTGLSAYLVYHYGQRRVLWQVINTLCDSDTDIGAPCTSGNQGGESLPIDAVTGEVYAKQGWSVIIN